tara:strand:- start:10 stop:228 length:219 start_codon:yes stop_codon:yes gene_type:complete
MKEITEYTDLPLSQQEPLAERIGDIDQINNMTPQERVREVVGWHLGDPYWYNKFEDWLNASGLEIVEKQHLC